MTEYVTFEIPFLTEAILCRRLFSNAHVDIGQDMLPNVDAGIFLDNDMLVLQDPAILWDRFKLFTPFTAIASAPVEAHYSRQMVSTLFYQLFI